MKLPRYPKYKDSGVKWLGQVPEHWEIKILKRQLAEPLMYGANEAAVDDNPENPRYVRITDIDSSGELREGTFKSLPTEIARQYLLKDGDILLARSGATVGKSFIYKSSWGTCCFAGYLIRARLHTDRASAAFVYAFLQSSVYWQFISSEQIQSTIQNVSAEKYNTLAVSSPPHEEQLEIATFLDCETGKIDGLIEEQQRLIELLKEKRQAIISHAVTKGLTPEASMKPTGVAWIGEIPEHWTVVRLKFIAYVQGGVAKGRNLEGQKTIEVPYLRVANVQDGYLDLDDISMIEIPPAELNRYSLKYGDVLMNEGGDYDKLGRGHIWREEIQECIHQNHVFAVRPMKIEPEWLNIVTSAECGRFYFMSRSKQSTNLASISSTNIQELAVPCPPREERLQIIRLVDEKVRNLDDLITNAESNVDLLTERRSSLITAAVTGQIDVRNYRPEEAPAVCQ